MKEKEHVKICVDADFLENGDIDFEGQLSGSIKNIVTLAGVFIGRELREAPEGAEKAVFRYLLEGMALGKFQKDTEGSYIKTVIPKREQIIELLRKEDNENGK